MSKLVIPTRWIVGPGTVIRIIVATLGLRLTDLPPPGVVGTKRIAPKYPPACAVFGTLMVSVTGAALLAGTVTALGKACIKRFRLCVGAYWVGLNIISGVPFSCGPEIKSFSTGVTSIGLFVMLYTY